MDQDPPSDAGLAHEAEPALAPPATAPAPVRSVRHEYTNNWPAILAHLRASLLVSTYQAGKLVAVSARRPAEGAGPGLDLAYHNFEKAMGLAVAPGRLAVGARSVVWLLRDAPEVAVQLDPPGSRDACYLARAAWCTGEIQGHEMAWAGKTLWVVNTLFSCLCTLDDRHSFVPRWRPPFISALAAEDRCHLNGLALEGDEPRWVTALGRTDTKGGWRPGKAGGGVLMEVPSGEVVAAGLCMPHSPRLVAPGRLLLLDSGTGRLLAVDTMRGQVDTVCALPGYARGLDVLGPLAFVGLSKIRETSTFGGVPIAEDRARLRCGVAVVDLPSGRQVALLEFHTGVEEIFDVKLVPGVARPALRGPHPDLDGTPPIWLAPAG